MTPSEDLERRIPAVGITFKRLLSALVGLSAARMVGKAAGWIPSGEAIPWVNPGHGRAGDEVRLPEPPPGAAAGMRSGRGTSINPPQIEAGDFSRENRIMRNGIVLLIFVLVAAAMPAAARAETDESALLALHEKVLEAHRKSDIEMLLVDESDDYVVSGRGEISRPAKSERREFLGPYLRATSFDQYRDEVPPVVRVSADGTMGWVIAQVRALGSQKGSDGGSATIEFVSSWCEFYEKRDGRWLRTGNISNFRP